MISAIVCTDKNWGIGYKGDLLIKIPEDMTFFKEKTNNKIVVMGRKTYDSLPVKPLPNRENIVITRKVYKDEYGRYKDEDKVVYAELDGIKNMFQFIQKYLPNSSIEIFVIGGASIYKELLPYCNRVYLTWVDKEFEHVDTYFPNLFNMPEWKSESSGDIKQYNGVRYQFCTFVREKESTMSSETNITIDLKNDFDDVTRPKHYTDGKIEVIDYIEDKNLGFCLGNVVKYVSRAGKKHSADKSDKEKMIQDLKKAQWYLSRRIMEIEEELCD